MPFDTQASIILLGSFQQIRPIVICFQALAWLQQSTSSKLEKTWAVSLPSRSNEILLLSLAFTPTQKIPTQSSQACQQESKTKVSVTFFVEDYCFFLWQRKFMRDPTCSCVDTTHRCLWTCFRRTWPKIALWDGKLKWRSLLSCPPIKKLWNQQSETKAACIWFCTNSIDLGHMVVPVVLNRTKPVWCSS